MRNALKVINKKHEEDKINLQQFVSISQGINIISLLFFVCRVGDGVQKCGNKKIK